MFFSKMDGLESTVTVRKGFKVGVIRRPQFITDPVDVYETGRFKVNQSGRSAKVDGPQIQMWAVLRTQN